MKAVLVSLLAAATALATDSNLLEWMNKIAQDHLTARSKRIAAITTGDAAEARKKEVRGKILELIGGLPDFDGPLNARTAGTLDRGDFLIERVLFESLPRIYVTANLYRPKGPGKHPGILLPMGHWEQGKIAAQRIASNLALKGFVVLAFDPLGQGERQQAYDKRLGTSLIGGSTEQHFMAGAQSLLMGQSFARYRVWDAKRALDYLVSRPEVDADRIGCTGCSGGGTLATYISALDPRIKVAAPACYMNSFQVLFSGSVGDSEQSLPDFLSSGLDQTDYVELFAPKPWLILSTEKDFFTPAGAKIVYEEAKEWYKLYGAQERIEWIVGPGPHGTPLKVREGIYAWFIRWLKNNSGNAAEETVQLVPEIELWVTPRGQVEDGRDIYEVIRETPRLGGSRQQMVAYIRKLVKNPADRMEPVTELLMPPNPAARNPAILYVETSGTASESAKRLAAKGYVVQIVRPRGTPVTSTRLAGDWITNTRAWLIGRNLPGMRAQDILAALDRLASRPDVDPKHISGVAHEVAGVWLLMAAATDSRFSRIWLDGTPHSFRSALDNPVHRNLHDAVLPGFALRWDLADIVAAIGPKKVIWSNPVDWMGRLVALGPGYRYTAQDPSPEAVWQPPGIDEPWQ